MILLINRMYSFYTGNIIAIKQLHDYYATSFYLQYFYKEYYLKARDHLKEFDEEYGDPLKKEDQKLEKVRQQVQ